MLVLIVSILLFGIEDFLLQLEEPFYFFTMLGFYNKIYNIDHTIIGQDPKKDNKNVYIGMAVTADAIEWYEQIPGISGSDIV